MMGAIYNNRIAVRDASLKDLTGNDKSANIERKIEMNVFEERIKMLEKNEWVFEQYCRNEKSEVLISNAQKEN
ncbi:MAG: hypothetical protein K2K70_11475 [Lachnospiraceae bacterium]|nr:hypothetical protein [Lachnospiraceae bacterium]